LSLSGGGRSFFRYGIFARPHRQARYQHQPAAGII
jgi:hypothetical protein